MWQHDHLSVSLSVISCNQKRAETCSFVFSIINRAAASIISALTIHPPTGIHTASSNFNVFLSLTSGHHHPTHSGHPHIFNKSSSSFQLNFFSSFSIWLILRNSLLHCKWGIIQISKWLAFQKKFTVWKLRGCCLPAWKDFQRKEDNFRHAVLLCNEVIN